MEPDEVVKQEPVSETQEQPEAETPEVEPVEPKPEPTELEKKLKASEREVDRHRRQAEYWRQNYQKQVQPPAATVVPAAETDPEPQEDAFGENTLAYAKAYSAWIARDVVRQDNAKRQTESRQQVAQTREQAYVFERTQKMEEAAQIDPEAWTACDTLGKMGVVIGTPLQDALHESENFSGLVKNLAANPQEVQRILLLSPVQQIREIARLEQKIGTVASGITAAEPSPLRTSGAPAPVKQLNTSSASTRGFDVNDPNVPIDEWMKREAARVKAKKSA